MAGSRSTALVLAIAALLVSLSWHDAAARNNGQPAGAEVECSNPCDNNVMTKCIDGCNKGERITADKCWRQCSEIQAKCTKPCRKEPLPPSTTIAN
ncbi:hypothetical protein M0R45_021383 [Rubus argutus]|uniref:Uncharacterized protein n=1 Tax=Rubus argutus TaxID=59490 RepID=A0AAW1XBA8_RUBAR